MATAEEILEYISDHLDELRDDLEHNADRADYEYYGGAIEVLEHFLAKYTIKEE